jgi:Amt family ammonium transporter
MAAAAAMLGWLIVEKLRGGHATTLGAASGLVAGLVAITPCAGFVTGFSSIAIGFIAGVVCYVALGIKKTFKLDDSLDVIAVHLVGGTLGSILLGFFAAEEFGGLLFGGGASLLGYQLIAVGATLVFSFVLSFVIAKLVDVTIGLRVDEPAEIEGLDISQHAENAYTTVV